MKQSIIVVLFAALVCSITQPGFAADFTLRFQGVQIKNLSNDVARVDLFCSVMDSRGVNILTRTKDFVPIQDQNGSQKVISAPFNLELGNNAPQRDNARQWRCYFKLFKGFLSSEGKIPVACSNGIPPAGVEAFQCVDPSSFHLLQAGGTITP